MKYRFTEMSLCILSQIDSLSGYVHITPPGTLHTYLWVDSNSFQSLLSSKWVF